MTTHKQTTLEHHLRQGLQQQENTIHKQWKLFFDQKKHFTNQVAFLQQHQQKKRPLLRIVLVNLASPKNKITL